MIIVIDANCVIAALIKDGKARQIILSGQFTLISPEFLTEEVEKHINYISKKSGIPKQDLDLLVLRILQRIELISKDKYRSEIVKAKEIINDPDDVAYVACYLALGADGIWTNDFDYDEKGLKVLKTEYLLKLL